MTTKGKDDGRPETGAEALRRELEEMAKEYGTDADTERQRLYSAVRFFNMKELGINPLDLDDEQRRQKGER